MVQNWINFIYFIFWLSFFCFIINPTNLLHILLFTEILWLFLYTLSILIAVLYDDCVSFIITVFLLGFSVVDIGIGLILAFLQKSLLNTDLLNDNINSTEIQSNQLSNFLFLPRFIWAL